MNSLGLRPRKLLQAKGYIRPYIPRLVLIQYLLIQMCDKYKVEMGLGYVSQQSRNLYKFLCEKNTVEKSLDSVRNPRKHVCKERLEYISAISSFYALEKYKFLGRRKQSHCLLYLHGRNNSLSDPLPLQCLRHH